MNADRFVPFVLEPYRQEWQDAQIDLIRRCYAEYGQEIELDTLDSDLFEISTKYMEPQSTFQVLRDGNKLIGSVAVHGSDAGEAELKRVFLDREYRGRGLGKALSLWAFDWARASGYPALHIWSDAKYTVAHNLYRSLNAQETGATRLLGGINDVSEVYFHKTWESEQSPS